ncbi:MAG: FHA domain-containing protein [Gemmataceae bacterium]
MSFKGNGELIPVGGGDPVPLLREQMTLGRRESCDICLKFPNVSGLHCEFVYRSGHWIVRDMGSTNGLKVNGVKTAKRVLHPEDVITIAKRSFTIKYTPIGQQSLDEILDDADDIMDVPLLEKAGLARPPREEGPTRQRISSLIKEIDNEED